MAGLPLNCIVDRWYEFGFSTWRAYPSIVNANRTMKRAAWILKMAGLPLNCSYPLCSDERSCWVRMIMENVIFASSDRTMGVRRHPVHRFTIVP